MTKRTGQSFNVCLFGELWMHVMLGMFPASCRVLAAVDRADPLQLFLCLPPPPGQAEDPTAAETEGDQPDCLQRSL